MSDPQTMTFILRETGDDALDVLCLARQVLTTNSINAAERRRILSYLNAEFAAEDPF